MFLPFFSYQSGLSFEPLLDRGEQDFLFLVGGLADHGRVLARLDAEMDQQRRVAAVVEDHVRRAAVRPFEDAMLIVPVVLQALALDREHRRAAGGDRRRGMILGRIDVAGGPAHVGAERPQRFDQHRGLNRHVQRAGDARAAQRLLRSVFLACRHQAGHLGLGDGDFLAAPFGEADVFDGVIGGRGFGLRCGGHDDPCCWKSCASAARPGAVAVAIAGAGRTRNDDIRKSLYADRGAP